jgi:serine/threonine protein kinase
MEAIAAGTVIDAGGGAHKATTAWERLVADDDGMVRDNKPFTVGPRITSGDVCDLYECSDQPVVLKICRKQSDNDLMDSERGSLNAVYPPGTKEEKFYRYLPHIVAGFEWKGHRAHVLPNFREYLSLGAILKAYPEGIDFRDWAWMFRRVLEGIGFVHQRNYVHGALVLPHVLVHPKNHGARLIDWCYSKPLGEPLTALPQAYRDYYPPEVFAKGATSVSTDLYVAAKTSIALLGGNPSNNTFPDKVPEKLQEFLSQTLTSNPARRPVDAWAYREELGALLRDLVGKPTYREFKMPS